MRIKFKTVSQEEAEKVVRLEQAKEVFLEALYCTCDTDDDFEANALDFIEYQNAEFEQTVLHMQYWMQKEAIHDALNTVDAGSCAVSLGNNQMVIFTMGQFSGYCRAKVEKRFRHHHNRMWLANRYETERLTAADKVAGRSKRLKKEAIVSKLIARKKHFAEISVQSCEWFRKMLGTYDYGMDLFDRSYYAQVQGYDINKAYLLFNRYKETEAA